MPSIKQLIRSLDFKPRRSSDIPLSVGTAVRTIYNDSKYLIDCHFKDFSTENHPCRTTMAHALELLENKPAHIIETGSSAWGTNSSLLFDSYVNSFGGKLDSVDIRPDPANSLKRLCSPKSRFFCNDSIAFLKKIASDQSTIDLLYLDSWDVDWSDPVPSALHGLNEFLTIYPALQPGSLLLIDDTPLDVDQLKNAHPDQIENFYAACKKYSFTPGKGSLVKIWLQERNIGQQLSHGYQLLWRM